MFYSVRNSFIYVCSSDPNWICQNLASTSLIYTSFMISQSFFSKVQTLYSRINGRARASENIFIPNILKYKFASANDLLIQKYFHTHTKRILCLYSVLHHHSKKWFHFGRLEIVIKWAPPTPCPVWGPQQIIKLSKPGNFSISKMEIIITGILWLYCKEMRYA